MTMAMARPWYQKRQMLLFIVSIPRHSKRTLTTNTKADVSKVDESHGRNIGNHGIGFRGDVERLCNQSQWKDDPHVLYLMDQRGIRPSSSTYAYLLQECVNCKALQEGKLVHAHMIATGCSRDIFLETKLVIMYAKCGNLTDARRVLDEMPERNVVSWTAMIAEYVKHEYDQEALTLFFQMQRTGIQPNQFTFASVLPACAKLVALEHGKNVHGDIIRRGFESDVFVERALVDMYIKCGDIESAHQVFEKMSERNVVSWTAIVAGYAQSGRIEEALNLFQTMPERNVVTWNAMIAGYTQNGYVEEASKVFQKMPERNVISWTAMITGYAQNGYCNEALKYFLQMQLTGVKPNSVTFASVLPACANLEALEHGKKVHEDIIRGGFQSNVFVERALVDMYIKCGQIEDARIVFEKMPERNIVSWTAMIVGNAQNGHIDEALKLFQKMPERDIVSWNAMLGGYTHNGYFNEALNLFQQMQMKGVEPNPVAFATVLPACANLAACENGKKVHEDIIRRGFQSNVFVGDALVDMYAKCGSIGNARKVFDKMPKRNVVSWTAMIVGYAMHGCGREALELFEQMQHRGTKPNHVTFIGVLSACCHAGLVDDGWQYFDRMSRDYRITPAMEHYCCMVDLLGRAGHLDEAGYFISKMPIKPNAVVWGSLLGACRIHINTELGERAAECLFELDPKNAAHYLLLSNIYEAVGRSDDAERVQKMMRDRGIKKRPGCSWIEVNNKVHTFLVGDRSHPQTQQIYEKLERLSGLMEEAGYVPNTNFDLHDAEEQMEHILFHYSQNLAIPFDFGELSKRSKAFEQVGPAALQQCSSPRLFHEKLL